MDLMYNANGVYYDFKTFEKMLILYNDFKNCGVNCEIIAYDTLPHTGLYGFQLEFLWIDVVNDFYESLLSDTEGISDSEKKCLNSFGLLKTPEDIGTVLENSFCGNCIWKLCRVYRVNV